ncbi:DUF305 domain-containing protein [Microbispora sp. NPDC088329]|uniref:DUF305 domain-containing protein n=1 Tax=Microbispora sp. NPDC088329 TaxID=3154869 RepID=UPI00343AFC14
MRGRVLPAALLAAGLLTGGARGAALAATAPAQTPAQIPAQIPAQTPAPTPAAPVGTTLASDHNEQDVMFARMMIPHHRQAVEMAKLAEGRASDPRVVRLAERIEAAQSPEIRTMSGWLTAWGEPVSGESPAPAHRHAMPGMMSPEEMRRLEGLSGRAFDREFLSMMIRHHEGAVTMGRDELRGGVYEPARRLAASVVSSQSAEITEMKRLRG